MTSVRSGVDIVDVERIDSALARGQGGFARTVFTAQELAYIDRAQQRAERAAGLWAAKESVVKAFGVGFANGVWFHDVEITHLPSGQPTVRLHGALAALAAKSRQHVMSISISHSRTHAIAFALVGAAPPQAPPS